MTTPASLVPSTTTGSVIARQGRERADRLHPRAGDVEGDRVQARVSVGVVRIAWRSEPIPLSLVLVTTNGLTTATAVENCEVSFVAGEVAVAVIT